jgi:DNA-binding transcriptional LysR family regulator
MNYTFHQLQVFIKIVETQSVTKASEELHMTQPAASIQLKNFQDQFDIPLTEIVGRKIQITDFGNEIYRLSKSIMEEVQNINYKTQAYKGLLAGRLTLSIVSTGKYVMPYFLKGFLKKHPEIDLVMDVTNKNKVVKSLEKNEVDFSLVSVMPNDLDLNEEKLLSNHLFLIGNKESEIKRNKQPIDLLASLPLIYREEGSGTRYVMENFIKQNKVAIRKKMALTSNEAVKQAVIAGLGYSIMPLIGIKQELNLNELQIVPVKGLPIHSEWRLIWLKNKKLSPIALAYLNYVQQEKAKILKENFSWIKDFIK